MRSLLDLSTTAKRFRFVAVLEAITWLALLIGMFFKWVLGHEAAVSWPGRIHGTVFVIFVIVAIVTAFKLAWITKDGDRRPGLIVTGLALLSSIPPFGTVIFERWAVRNGHLGELSQEAGFGPVPVQA